MNRQRKKKESAVKMIFLILIAVLVMTAAIYVVVRVFGKISSDYKELDFSKAEETTHIEIDTDEGPKAGWYETDEGWRYYLDEKNFVTDAWKEIGGYLYHFGEDGFMITGEWKQEGQIFTFHDTKGYLKKIGTDLDYVPESTGENLDSLVRTNAFWCFLKDEEGTGLFKTIMYRRTVENKIMVLGGESAPERTTKNSMRAYGDYVYFLPKVKESQLSRLSEAEKGLCNKLFRMMPGRNTKELIAENVEGYLVLDDIIYYSQGGKILSATSGTEMATGEARYSVVIKDDSCYLVDEMGNPAVAESGNSVNVGDRIYRIEEDGLIKYVKHGQLTIDGKTYYLGGSGTNTSVNVKQDGRDTGIIKETYGVQSYCIVDNQIYYSSYVEKTASGEWYSQIFKTDMDGQNKQAVSERFPGVMQNMYYYEDEGQIYGEYHPAIWKQAYGVAAVISRDGNIYRINDSSARTGKHVDGNDMLEIVMARDGKVICLWHDCDWNRSSGITSVLWSKAIELNSGDRVLIDMAAGTAPEESSATEETDAIVQPIITPPSDISPSNTPTVAPVNPSINNDPLISTDKPGQETLPTPTVPPVSEPSGNVQIIPIG
ncbi:DUF5050 domain-containing protein [Enterocloster citroniae]|uniref:DUF5050 domain-containing protein n=1 Tax=Enterocloster citroniae TaxID=358743 RepID=UPI001897C312|nr:DUF5050 domain-containing protein [Enterocloster citroniae]MBS1482662.1 DUF5050 domain-containing protein [Clostridium sp.]